MKIAYTRHKKSRLEEVFEFIEDQYFTLSFEDFEPNEIREYCSAMMDFVEFCGDILCYQVHIRTFIAPFQAPFADDYHKVIFRFLKSGDTKETEITYVYSPTTMYIKSDAKMI